MNTASSGLGVSPCRLYPRPAVRSPHRGRRAAGLLAVLGVVGVLLAVVGPGVGVAASFVPISGSGSTWSSNAVDQWRRNVATNYGMTVNFAPNGSTSGRNDFRAGQVDFADSDIPYGLTDGGVLDPNPTRAFGYMPIVAGGTAFMYNLKIGNNRVSNLRLSGDTITKIFTQQITKWDDPAIKADNPGLLLPGRAIVPVVYSNGSGASAQFTMWMADQYGPQWDAYCHKNGRNLTPCGFTSFYPQGPGMEAKAQSQGVAGFVAQASSEGSITYVEYSYARNAGFPVAKVLNKANYYVEPKAGSVAVALLKAQLHPDLTQDLAQVYINGDPRTYPLSSYSYMIVPKDTTQNFSTDKGVTLSEFAAYFLCEGQQQADTLGYSPLPINLVQAGVDQINQIPGSTKKLDRNNLAHCNNPTVSPDGGNKVAKDAPQPDPCDLKGTTQCTTGTAGAQNSTPTSPGSPAANNTAAGATDPAAAAAAGATTDPAAAAAAGGAGTTDPAAAAAGATTDPTTGATTDSTTAADGTTAAGAEGTTAGTDGTQAGTGQDGATVIDPDTGQVISRGGTTTAKKAAGTTTTAGTTTGPGATAVPVSVDADNRPQMLLTLFAVILLLALVLGPPLVAHRIRSRDGPHP
ncbi:MAG TPA: phosphate ABC transporter substrate-binding protein PstS [Pseudonocardiaceae bacterium]